MVLLRVQVQTNRSTRVRLFLNALKHPLIHLHKLLKSINSTHYWQQNIHPNSTFSLFFHAKWTKIRRFSEEVNFDIVALSGKRFFFLTRSLVLSVAGTIITYELVSIYDIFYIPFPSSIWYYFFEKQFNIVIIPLVKVLIQFKTDDDITGM